MTRRCPTSWTALLALDADVVVSALSADAPDHAVMEDWLARVVAAPAPVGVSDVVVGATVRIITNPGICTAPVLLEAARDGASRLRDHDGVVTLAPGPSHWRVFQQLCREERARGSLVADAQHAAVAVERGATWISEDGDVARFPGVRWRHLLDHARAGGCLAATVRGGSRVADPRPADVVLVGGVPGCRPGSVDVVRRLAAVVVVGASTAVVSGCGSAPGPAGASPTASDPAPLVTTGERDLVPEAHDGRYRTSATVLESPEHGPQLCCAIAASLPPQCGGPEFLGWDWAAVPAEAPRPKTIASPHRVPSPPAAGCLLTRHGPDPARATEAAAEQARAVATATPGFAASWIDQRVPDADTTPESADDPQRYVLDVSTTGDVAGLEAALREVWGGSLCVSTAPRSEADLLAIHAALPELPGWFGSGPDPLAGVVDLSVAHGTLEQQQALDEQFGAGAVRLSSQLEPID